MGINRNIVECKFIPPIGILVLQVELIETLWNVNMYQKLLLTVKKQN